MDSFQDSSTIRPVSLYLRNWAVHLPYLYPPG